MEREAVGRSLRSASLETDDRALLERAANGDERSFADLMQRHEQKIFALTYRIVGNRTDALDATQDTFINVFRRAGDFRGDSAFSTWIYRIAVNASKDLIRKRNRLPFPEEDLPEPSSSAPSTEDHVGNRIDLTQALERLPDDYREAVLLFDVCGVPYEEIASLTGAALGTVKSRISRGRRRLAQLMEQGTPPETSKEQ